jgi:hypothetical protein
MDQGEHFALNHAWWAWDHELIRRALSAALLRHWVPVVAHALQENAINGRMPSTWEGLTTAGCLRRNSRNLRRVKGGASAPTHEFLLGVASILKLSVRELIPDTARWIELATLEVSKGDVSPEDAESYANFRLACAANLAPALIAASWRAAPSTDNRHESPPASADVLRVAKAIGPVLSMIDRELRKREA